MNLICDLARYHFLETLAAVLVFFSILILSLWIFRKNQDAKAVLYLIIFLSMASLFMFVNLRSDMVDKICEEEQTVDTLSPSEIFTYEVRYID